MASHGKVCLRPRSGKQYSLQRAVAQLGSALEWGSRGRGFKSRRPDWYCEGCFMFTFFGARRPVAAILVPARMLMNVCVATMPVIRKPRDTVFLGLCSTAKVSRLER